MHSRPRLKSSLRAEIVADEGVYILGEQQNHLLRGQAFLKLAPLLDGRSTEEELCQRLGEHLPPAEVLHALNVLRQWGFLAHEDVEVSASEAAFWEGLGVAPSHARARLKAARVELLSCGRVDMGPLAESLAALGLSTGRDGDRVVVLAEDYLHPELGAFNRARLADGRPWLLVRPTGQQAWLGPAFVPGRTGCWHCLSHRLEGHRRVERYLEHRLKKEAVLPPALASLSATRQLVASMVATTIARWLAVGSLPELEGQVLTFGTASFETGAHVLTRRPQCPSCGDAGLMARQHQEPVRLESSARAFTADGGHREVTPEETVQRISRQVSPVTGIISQMVRTGVPGADLRLLFSYCTDHNFVLSNSLYDLRHNLRIYSGGKGRTDVQARASALCESIERYSGVWQGDEARHRATLEQLGGDAIHPEALLGFSRLQYAHREEWNRPKEMFAWVPEPFEPARAIDWTPVWSLTEGRRRYVPTALCFYGYPFGGEPMFGLADSNGCAAGNTRTEAILQGFFELVERDAVALWWYNRLRRPGVELASFGEPYLLEVVEHWRTRGRELWVLDLTTDLGIPTFAAVSRCVTGPSEAMIFGFGTHFDARVALLRAVTEHNQLIVFVPGAQGAVTGSLARWIQQARAEQERYVLPAEGAAPRTLSDFPRHRGADLREDVERCVDLARRRGLETLVLDQTRPDTGIAVVKVIVPGLRHFWARLGPGRLYDVPVRMGWLPAPLPEEALNPHPMFI